MQRKKKKRESESGRKGRGILPSVPFAPTRNAIFLHCSTLTFFLPPSDILSSTNRKTCQLRFSQSSRSALYKELFRGERARMRAAWRVACTCVHTRACTLHRQEGHPRDTYTNTPVFICMRVCIRRKARTRGTLGHALAHSRVARDTDGMDFTLWSLRVPVPVSTGRLSGR